MTTKVAYVRMTKTVPEHAGDGPFLIRAVQPGIRQGGVDRGNLVTVESPSGSRRVFRRNTEALDGDFGYTTYSTRCHKSCKRPFSAWTRPRGCGGTGWPGQSPSGPPAGAVSPGRARRLPGDISATEDSGTDSGMPPYDTGSTVAGQFELSADMNGRLPVGFSLPPSRRRLRLRDIDVGGQDEGRG